MGKLDLMLTASRLVSSLPARAAGLLAALALLAPSTAGAQTHGAGDANTVLLAAGSASTAWQLQAEDLGLTVEEADATAWNLKTAIDFATYKAIILSDLNCNGPAAFAVSTRAIWTQVVTGNVFVVGGDPDFHANVGVSGAVGLIRNGIWFAANDPGKTGAYIALGFDTDMTVLDQFGTFAAAGNNVDDVHKVAVHPALTDLTDGMLSNWSTSTHLGFTAFPVDFITLAIQNGVTGTGELTFGDGSSGVPYILARGSGVQPVGLNISKSAAESAIVGSNLTYTITYGNSGGTDATLVVLTDPVPAHTTFVSASNSGALVGGNVVWNIGNLAHGVIGQTVTFTVRLNSIGPVTNTNYTIAASGVSAVTGSDVTTTVSPQPIPTLSEWGMIVFSGLLTLMAYRGLQRQRAQALS